MLHDFSFHTLDELLAGLTKSNGSQSATAKSGMGDSMNISAGSMGAMNMASDMAMDLNDIDYDAFLANDRTLADPEVIRTEPGGRVRLRLVNAASATQFWIDLGALSGNHQGESLRNLVSSAPPCSHPCDDIIPTRSHRRI
jgi:hypothetical protein